MSHLIQLYDNAVEQARKEGLVLTDDIERILDRKWAVSSDLENGIGNNGIILTGINPSFDIKKEKEPYTHQRYSLSESCMNPKRQYWVLAKEIFYENVLSHNIGFVDLFPIRCTDQNDFEQFDSGDTKKILKRNLLQVTQEEIERLSPRLIIHANKRSSFYWGIDKDYPWMGYEFGDIESSELPNKEELSLLISRAKGIEARTITGITRDDRSIRKNKELTSNLANHTIILFYCQLGYQQISNERRQKDKVFFHELFKLLDLSE